jgi:hypothetical protein
MLGIACKKVEKIFGQLIVIALVPVLELGRRGYDVDLSDRLLPTKMRLRSQTSGRLLRFRFLFRFCCAVRSALVDFV